MDTFYIIPNEKKDLDLLVTQRICNYVGKKGGQCILASEDEEGHIIPGTVPEYVDCAIVLGGDGTLIQAARDLLGYNIPVIGVNMGTLGYMAEVEIDDIEESMQKLLDDKYYLEIRMMIQGSVNGQEPLSAMNDVVVTRENGLRVVHFDVYVNDELLNTYQADGVIVSTPTGSTGYNLSAGGPILEPTANMVVITPICSHALNTSSIVLSADDEIRIEMGEERHGGQGEFNISFDGKNMRDIVSGQSVTIRKSDNVTKLMKLSEISFLEILRKKMKRN